MAALRMAGLVISLTGLIVLAGYAIRHRRRVLYLAPASLYLVHLAIFYAVRLLQIPIPVEAINTWSLTVHFHAALTIVGSEIICGESKHA